jgi:hypothetical protein
MRDPVGCPGARIPDTTFEQSTTFQFVMHGNVTASASGAGGVILGSPITQRTTAIIPEANVSCTINGGALGGVLGLASNPANATTSAPFSESATLNLGSIPIFNNSLSAFFNSNVDKARVVSMALTLRSTNSLTAQSGYFIAASLPRGFFDDTGLSGLGFLNPTVLQNVPGAVTCPVNAPNNENGITVTYSPTDAMSFIYGSTALTSLPISDPRSQYVNPGILAIMVLGPANGTYLYDLCINYECILQAGTLGFGVRPAFNDPLALAEATNLRQTDPLVMTDYNMWMVSPGSEPNDASSQIDLSSSQCSLFHHKKALYTVRGKNSKGVRQTKMVSEEEVGMFESLASDVGRVADKLKMILF